MERRPELAIKVFPEALVSKNRVQILQRLRKTNALILNLNEDVSNTFDTAFFPFITFKRVSSGDKLPSNLKLDGDPLSDYFITLQSARSKSSGGRSTSSESTETKSGYIILAFKVTDDDKTYFYDRTWQLWSGTAHLVPKLAQQYEVRKVACYKGVNVVPDVFKYVVLIEFLMGEGQDDVHARDCMQKFRIGAMTGYAAIYQDFHSKEIDEAIEEAMNIKALSDNSE